MNWVGARSGRPQHTAMFACVWTLDLEIAEASPFGMVKQGGEKRHRPFLHSIPEDGRPMGCCANLLTLGRWLGMC